VGGNPLAGPPFGVTFGSVAAGELVLYVDSAGRVALAVNRGNAAARLGLAAGDVVRIGPADAGSGGLGQP
jgi:S-adenosylmethionine hydrolase